MIYTFKDLRDQVLRALDEVGDTGTTKAFVNNLLNQANQYRAMEYANAFLVWDIPCTLVTEVGRQTYALHEEFMRPLYFFNRETQRYLKEVPERQLEPEGYQWNTSEGPAEHFVLWGRTQVERQPTEPSVLSIVSSDAADDGGSDHLKLMIRGEDANGRVVSEILDPDGTTPVTTTHTYRKIMQVTKAGPWTGTMTMTSNNGAVTNLVLENCDLGKMYQQLFLLESPIKAEEIEYRFYRNPIRMTNDYDLPDIPYPFSQILVWDTLVLMAGYNTEIDAKAVNVWRQMQHQMSVAMAENFQQGQSLGARVRFVRPFGADVIDSWGPLYN